MQSPATLFQSCDVFLKQAGLIKAPPVVLQTVSDWAVSVFCSKLVNGYLIPHTLTRLEQRKPDGERTLATKKLGEHIKQQWNRLNDFLNVYQGRYKTFDKLTSLDKFVIKVPFFELGKDKVTGLGGFIDTARAPMLFLSIEKTTNDQIRVFMSINGDEVINSFVREGDDLDHVLSRYDDRIGETCNEFIGFVSNPKLYRQSSDENILVVKRLIAFCNARIKKDISPAPNQQFSFSASSVLQPGIRKAVLNVKEVVIDVLFGGDNSRTQGAWDEKLDIGKNTGILHLGRLVVNSNIMHSLENIMTSPSKFGALENNIKDILTTVRHEVEHIFQSFTGYITQSNAGLPPMASREKSYDPLGVSRNNPKEPRMEHRLRDIEFYTNLGDSVSDYKRVMTAIPLYLKQRFFRSWVAEDNISPGEVGKLISFRENGKTNAKQWAIMNAALTMLSQNRPFFEQLKNFNQAKYQKAVKEFAKMVG